LLKVQELEDYLKNINGNDRTSQGVRLLEVEQAFINNFSVINFEQMSELNNQLANQIQQIPKSELNKVPDFLKKIPEGTVLFYPLILENRLELVLFSQGNLPISRTVNIKQADLKILIEEFRAELLDRSSEKFREPASKLYNILIKPIESELKQAKADTILYAPDGLLRYVPLSVLYDQEASDGKNWLIEKYRISYLIPYSLSDFSPKSKAQFSILSKFGGKGGERRFGAILGL
ncbi:MAG: CHAT domain-containing protein, partial [Pseudanabaena sp.]